MCYTWYYTPLYSSRTAWAIMANVSPPYEVVLRDTHTAWMLMAPTQIHQPTTWYIKDVVNSFTPPAAMPSHGTMGVRRAQLLPNDTIAAPGVREKHTHPMITICEKKTPCLSQIMQASVQKKWHWPCLNKIQQYFFFFFVLSTATTSLPPQRKIKIEIRLLTDC